MLLDQLENLKEHINHYEQEIQDILDKLPDSDSVKSLPGVGDRLAPELVATLGPNSKDGHQRFQAAEEIAKLSRCVPVVRESGKWRKVSLRYACVESLRRTFRDRAFTSINCSPWARAFYDETLHIQNLKARNITWAMAL